jgi:hypothetical protein
MSKILGLHLEAFYEPTMRKSRAKGFHTKSYVASAFIPTGSGLAELPNPADAVGYCNHSCPNLQLRQRCQAARCLYYVATQQLKRFPMFSLLALYLSYRKHAAQASAVSPQPVSSTAQDLAPTALPLAA